MKTKYKEQIIKSSGKRFYAVYKPSGGRLTYGRYQTIEACKVVIDAVLEQRPLTDAEYSLVYPQRSK